MKPPEIEWDNQTEAEMPGDGQRSAQDTPDTPAGEDNPEEQEEPTEAARRPAETERQAPKETRCVGRGITSTFRSTYLGNYRNSRDNQMLFIASLNASYFRQLAQENILDPDYANAASIDVEAQRAAWVASNKAEAADWDDDKVKATPFKRTVYLAGNVKILGSMTNLIFPINLF